MGLTVARLGAVLAHVSINQYRVGRRDRIIEVRKEFTIKVSINQYRVGRRDPPALATCEIVCT